MPPKPDTSRTPVSTTSKSSVSAKGTKKKTVTEGVLSADEIASVQLGKSSLEAAFKVIEEQIEGSAMAEKKKLICQSVMNHHRAALTASSSASSPATSPTSPALDSSPVTTAALELALQAFGQHLLLSLSNVHTHPPHSTHQQHANTPTEKPVDREVLLNTSKMPSDHPLRMGQHAEVKCAIKIALREAAPEQFLSPFTLHGVRILPNGNIVVQAHNAEDMTQIRATKEEWLAHVGGGIAIGKKTYAVVAHGVPISFNPGALAAREMFHGDNRGVVEHPHNITNLQWMHGIRTAHQNKTNTSVIITLDNEDMADNLIYTGASFNGCICETERYRPGPTQCFYCQQFGHMASACPHKNDPSKLRCAGPHNTSQCVCSHTTTCTDRRKCTHIQVRCANCNGPHKSFDRVCPEKAHAQLAASWRQDNGSPYFSSDFKPPRLSVRRL